MSLFELDRKDMIRMDMTIDRMIKFGVHTTKEAIEKGASWFITSAVKATKPGKKSTPKELQKKYKVRPVRRVTIASQKSAGTFYFYSANTNKAFILKRDLSRRFMKENNIKRVTQLVEAIKRKTGEKYFIPVNPFKGKADTKLRKIPKAGSAKAGWYAGKSKLEGGGGHNIGDINKNVNTTLVRMSGDEPSIIMINNVDYVTKTSPESARIGLRNASKRMEGFLKSEEEKMGRLWL